MFVLVKYIRDGIFKVLEFKDIKDYQDLKEQASCYALWTPNRVYYPAVVVKISGKH